MTGFDPKRRDMLKITAVTGGALAPTITNAILHATGRRIRELPVTPDKLL